MKDPDRHLAHVAQDCEAYAQRDTNKRSHGARPAQFGQFRSNFAHKAQNHSARDTPQNSQRDDHEESASSSGSETGYKQDRMPSLTDGSTCSSSNDKSASPDDDEMAQPESCDDEHPDERLPVLENAIFRINLHFPEREGEIPVLPSLGRDKVVQAAFEQCPSIGPHDGRTHGLSSSVYKEDQAWRRNPGEVNKLREQVAHEDEMHKLEEERRASEGCLSSPVDRRSNSVGTIPRHSSTPWLEMMQASQEIPGIGQPGFESLSQEVPGQPANITANMESQGSKLHSVQIIPPAPGHSTPSSSFTQNVESSTLDRPFRCTFKDCDWSFSRSSDQKRHIRSHSKPLLQCPYWEHNSSCHRNGGGFNRLDVLKRHLKLMHFDPRTKESGACKHCQQDFPAMKAFFDHCDSCAGELGSQLNKTGGSIASHIKPEHQ